MKSQFFISSFLILSFSLPAFAKHGVGTGAGNSLPSCKKIDKNAAPETLCVTQEGYRFSDTRNLEPTKSAGKTSAKQEIPPLSVG